MSSILVSVATNTDDDMKGELAACAGLVTKTKASPSAAAPDHRGGDTPPSCLAVNDVAAVGREGASHADTPKVDGDSASNPTKSLNVMMVAERFVGGSKDTVFEVFLIGQN
jgi:hypothetical protein